MSPHDRTLRGLILLASLGLSATLLANGAVILLISRLLPLLPELPDPEPVAYAAPPAGSPESIVEGGLFAIPEPPPPRPPALGPERCEGSLRLVGAMLTPERQMLPFAAIRGADGRSLLYQRGMEIEGRRVLAVERDRVVLERDGEEGQVTCELRLFEPGPQGDEARERALAQPNSRVEGGVEERGEGRYRVDRDFLRSLLSATHHHARAVPHHLGEPGGGVRLYGIRSGSSLYRLGLRNGDTLQRINGRSLLELDPSQLSRLARGSSFRIEILRRGAPTELRYELVGPLPTEAEINGYLGR